MTVSTPDPQHDLAHALYGSVTRITDLPSRTWRSEPLERGSWRNGDLVVGRVADGLAQTLRLELPAGRYAEPMSGDLVVGAFGTRAATLELVGGWRDIGDDGRMHVVTGGGVIGWTTSRSPLIPPPIELRYVGHVHVDGQPRRLQDYVAPSPDARLEQPVILIIGTSMSAGKTTAAKVIVRMLRQRGLRVSGAKITGAGRHNDILAMRDAGADPVYDFVDVGLPTTVVERDTYRQSARALLARIAAGEPDVAVIEAGASPLEPYRGDEAVALLGERVACTVLCASDPYAVVGLQSAFDRQPDVVTGICTNTAASIALIEKLSGVPALNVRDAAHHARLATVLQQSLGAHGAAEGPWQLA